MATGSGSAWRSAAELAALIRKRELSPVEVMQAVIARIEARNPSLNAMVFTDFEGALAAARKAEEAVMSGAELGPLHGVPTAMKDLFDFKPGWPAILGGVRALKDWRPDMYCPFVERIEAAGAIFVGRCNSPTLGFRGVTDNYLFGPTRQPLRCHAQPRRLVRRQCGRGGRRARALRRGHRWRRVDPHSGLVVRHLRLQGRRSAGCRSTRRPDAFTPAGCFIHEGPLTRTVEDAAIAMTALSGYDSRDPYSLDGSVDYLGALGRGIAGKRIAWTPDFGVYPVEPVIVETCRDALAAFREAGAIVEEVDFGITRDHLELADLWCKLIMPLTVGALETFKAAGVDLMGQHRDDFPPELLAWIDRAYAMSVKDLLAAQAVRTEIYDAVRGVLDRYDFIVSPTLAALPVKNGTDGNTLGPATINGEPVERLIGWCMTYFINFTGHPAASIPAGLAPGNLPVGLQIVGRRYADDEVFAASAAFERHRPWRDSYEICEKRPLG